MRIKKFKVNISGDTDVVTLGSAILSVLAVGWHVFNYAQGASVQLFPPDQVTIGRSDKVEFPARGGGPYVHFVGRFSYANKGAAGYNAVVQRELIFVKIQGSEAIEHRWFRFVESDAAGIDGEDLVVKKLSDARPFPINAGSAESHSSLSQPWPRDCSNASAACNPRHNYLEWDKFIELLENDRTIELTFTANIFGESEPIIAKCKIHMSKQSLRKLARIKWGSPICRN